jgi:hypothetical protein
MRLGCQIMGTPDSSFREPVQPAVVQQQERLRNRMPGHPAVPANTPSIAVTSATDNEKLLKSNRQIEVQ